MRPTERCPDREQKNVQHGMVAWQLSQFMHGEQGALIVASQLVGAVPWMEAKFYASSQTMDEARHVEVFSRYLHDKIEWEGSINPNLKKLLDGILLDSRWVSPELQEALIPVGPGQSSADQAIGLRSALRKLAR